MEIMKVLHGTVSAIYIQAKQPIRFHISFASACTCPKTATQTNYWIFTFNESQQSIRSGRSLDPPCPSESVSRGLSLDGEDAPFFLNVLI